MGAYLSWLGSFLGSALYTSGCNSFWILGGLGVGIPRSFVLLVLSSSLLVALPSACVWGPVAGSGNLLPDLGVCSDASTSMDASDGEHALLGGWVGGLRCW